MVYSKSRCQGESVKIDGVKYMRIKRTDNKIKTMLVGILLISSILLISLDSKKTIAATQTEDDWEFFESFEEEPFTEWSFAPPSAYNQIQLTSHPYAKDETHVLKAEGTGNRYYDGVQHYVSFSDGSIEAWVFPSGSNYLRPCLWIRTTTMDPNEDPCFRDGYLLRIDVRTMYLYCIVNGVSTWTLTKDIGYIMNSWCKLKLQVIGDEIDAWVEKSGINYHLERSDSTHTSGKAAFSARTNVGSSYYTYFDAVKISYTTDRWDEGFETWSEVTEQWDFDSSRFTQSSETAKKDTYSLKAMGNGEGKYYDGVLFKETEFSDGSIECWTLPYMSNYLKPSLWIRATEFSTEQNPAFNDGYLLRLGVQSVELLKVENGLGTILDSDNSIGYIVGNWWHLKLVAHGNRIEAEIIKGVHGNPTTYLSYEDNDEPFYVGQAGMTASTTLGSPYAVYFDEVIIIEGTTGAPEGSYRGYTYNQVGEKIIDNAFVELLEDKPTGYEVLKSVYSNSEGYYYLSYTYTGSNNLKIRASKNGDFVNIVDVQTAFPGEVIETDLNLDTVYRMAVIVGIGSCSPTCVNDVSAWYYHLNDNLEFDEIYLYGNNPEQYNYPIYMGDATEYRVKTKLEELTQKADANDVIVYTFSGHGDDGLLELGEGHSGETYSMQMVDYNRGEHGEDGWFHDDELADIVDNIIAGRIFLFLDSCHSGGFKSDGHFNDLENVDNIFLAMACTNSQSSYCFTGEEDPQRGKFSYYFLDYAWISYYGGTSDVSLEDCFFKAKEELDQESPDQDAQVLDTDPYSFYI